jgi:hypothetical protein
LDGGAAEEIGAVTAGVCALAVQSGPLTPEPILTVQNANSHGEHHCDIIRSYWKVYGFGRPEQLNFIPGIDGSMP